MKTIPFRDVLWGSVYELGTDPARKLLKDQAESLVSYINAWVRRLYPSKDFPDWTKTEMRTPDANHIVSYQRSGGSLPPMERIFKVYLTDPNEDGTAIDTPFRLMESGVHVGFEHGQNVWIKFIEQAPRYASNEWDVSATYRNGDRCYSPSAYECFQSKTNGNLGNDPAAAILGQPLTTEVTQQAIAPNPGLPGTTKKLTVNLRVLGNPALPVDPLPVGDQIQINVRNASGSAIASALHVSAGDLLTAVAADLATQLSSDPDLATFTIAAALIPNPPSLPINAVRFEDLSDFTLTAFYIRPASVDLLEITQQQAYLPATPPTEGQPELIKVSITDAQISRGTRFAITVIDALGTEHTFDYVAGVSDTAVQVLNGLAVSLALVSGSDEVLSAMHSSVDVPGRSITFSSPRNVGLDATFAPVASPFWELIPFPLDLAEQVMRGAYADLLKEQGQIDKGSAEEQAVPTEQAAKLATLTSQQYDPLTDQEAPRSRYKVT